MIAIAAALFACQTDPDIFDSGLNLDSGTTNVNHVWGTIVAAQDTSPAQPMTIGWVSISFGEGPTLGTTLASTLIDTPGEFSLALPEATPEDEISTLTTSGQLGSLYVLLVFEDDGDGQFESGEMIRGGTLSRLLVYLVSPQNDWPEGYSLVDTGLSGVYETGNCLLDTDKPLLWRDYAGYPEFHPIDQSISMVLQGHPAQLTMSGSNDLANNGLVVLPYQTVEEGQNLTAFSDTSINETFQVTLTDPPPEDTDINADPDWRYALGIPLAYTDTDDDSTWSSSDDTTRASTCLDGETAVARYTRPVSNYRGWRVMECYGAQAGWRLVTKDSVGGWKEFRSSEEATSLSMSENCQW